MIEVFHSSKDEVIRSSVSAGVTTYEYALTYLLPLLNRFEQQRKIQGQRFYSRLRKDILSGCVMPPITLAFVNHNYANIVSAASVQDFVNNNIQSGYVLDGMQRLNTLKNASEDVAFAVSRNLYVNIIIAERYDFLLYRMITLNNGQKPMTARHQIEMLTKGILDTEALGIHVVSEKETEHSKPQGAFKQSDIAEAYTAFLTDSVHNQNSKIIESKLDEILVGKVMDSNLTESTTSFHDILVAIDRFSQNLDARDWLRLGNNLIGFSVGAKGSIGALGAINPNDFAQMIKTFESAFESINVSKVNVGKLRRELAAEFIRNIETQGNLDADKLTEVFFEKTLSD